MKRHTALVAIAFASLLLLSRRIDAQQSGVLGYWKEPSGSTLHIEMCGMDVCAFVAAISPTAPLHIDAHNPDPALRRRSLCGLRIGERFKLESPTRAVNGNLYDPKTGKTYRGLMESHDDELHLRGYIGFSLLGRTEKWNRAGATEVCRY